MEKYFSFFLDVFLEHVKISMPMNGAVAYVKETD